ncbi:MAG: DUF5719 family protein [Bowdeniella nasicola]|nr:DUF5719 family protein [Bowdeniella nasicola]
MNLRSALRTTTAAITAALTGGAAVALVILNPTVLPGQARSQEATQVDLSPSDYAAVCFTGPVVGSQSSGDSEFGQTSEATHSITSLTQLPRLERDAAGPAPAPGTYMRGLSGQSFPLAPLGAGSALTVENESEPGLVSVPVNGPHRPLVAAGTVSINPKGDQRGLSAYTCQEPDAEAWLVGAASTVGTRSELVISNPGKTAATVDIDVYTERGKEADGPGQLSIAAGSSQRIVLGGSVPDAERLAVHVQAEGGRVAPAIIYSALDGITPQGSGIVAAGSGPATEQFLTGVVLNETSAGSSVRLVNTGDDVGKATVTVWGKDGASALPGAEDLTLDPGAVQDLTLDGIEPGAYSISVTSNSQVVVAAQVNRAGAQGARATTWIPASKATTALAVPILSGHSLTSELVLAAPADSEAQVLFALADGSYAPAQNVTVTGEQTVTVEVPAQARGVVVTASTPVFGGVVVSTDLGDGPAAAVLTGSADADQQRSVKVSIPHH